MTKKWNWLWATLAVAAVLFALWIVGGWLLQRLIELHGAHGGH